MLKQNPQLWRSFTVNLGETGDLPGLLHEAVVYSL